MKKSYTFIGDVEINGKKVKYESAVALTAFDLKTIKDECDTVGEMLLKDNKKSLTYKGLVFDSVSKEVKVRISPFNPGEIFGRCHSKYHNM